MGTRILHEGGASSRPAQNTEKKRTVTRARRLCALALFRVRGGRTFNATDASMLKMGDYFDLVADAHGLPRPPRLPRSELATRLSPLTLSFMNESRRLDNRRLAELRVRLRSPDVAAGLRDAGTRPPRDADE